jgi:hypothetical protein
MPPKRSPAAGVETAARAGNRVAEQPSDTTPGLSPSRTDCARPVWRDGVARFPITLLSDFDAIDEAMR